MRVGIDVSQLAYEKTGVANYLKSLVQNMVKLDEENEYILFFSSLRKQLSNSFVNELQSSRVTIKTFTLPPILLDILWNKLHILPIEWFIGSVDVFITSDWTEPPARKAKKATILYDLIVYKYPEETHNLFKFSLKNLLITPNIVSSQKRKLKWVKKESDIIFCISESTKKDTMDVLGISSDRLKVVYPGL
jgi:hypothetical protein